MNLINNAQAAIEKAIRHFRCMADDARIVLDSGFGTHPGECDLLYRNRKLYAELAIAALEEQQRRRWVPVAERLPEKNSTYHLVTTKRSPRIEMAWYLDGNWSWNNSDVRMDDVVAWQPLPEPYRPEDTE